MSLKSLNPQSILMPVFVLFSFLISGKTQAQCAGTDASIEICDYANPANQSINLFALLGPDAVPGGFWVDPIQTGALNVLTGELDVWNLHLSTTFTFAYIVNNIPGCVDNNAVVSVTVGGYSGVTSPNGSACDSNTHVNLFEYFIGMNPYPQQNGTWTSPNVGIVDGNFFDANATGPGTYSFTYTMPQIGSCPEVSSTAIVTVYHAPVVVPEYTELYYCSNDDFSTLTNFNLADVFQGSDPNGIWTESGTSEFSGPFDSFIDLQHLYNTSGVGDFLFTYTVFPEHPVCEKKSGGVRIFFDQFIDLTGATLSVEDVCEDETDSATALVATLTEGIQNLPDGNYGIDYNINGPGGSHDYNASVEFLNGNNTATFNLDPTYFTLVGAYTITITNIEYGESHEVCDNIAGISTVMNINPLPYFTNAVINIPPGCKGSDLTVNITGIDNLEDGNYQLTYDMYASNKAFGQLITISVVNGVATFNIPASVVPNSGNSTLFITHVLNLQTGCDVAADNFRTFTIYDPPFVENITVTVNSGCLTVGTPVLLSDLGEMTSVMMTYDLSGANTATGQSATFTATLGNGSFTIPPSLLPNAGITTITITRVTDLITGCSIAANIPEKFLMNTLPEVSSLNVVINDVCSGTPVSVSVSGLGNQANLVLNYSLSGANNAALQTITLTDTGNTEFIIPSGLIPNTGATTFTIVNITNTLTGCISPLNTPVVFNINPIPPVNTFSAAIQSVCIGQPVYALLSGFGNVTNMDITYSLSGVNTAAAQTASLIITNGSAVFNIPAALIPNSGNTTFSITHAIYPDTGCNADAVLTRNFTINPLPNVTALAVQIADVCFGSAVAVSLSGLPGSIPLTVSYTLSGSNTTATQSVNVTPTAGNATFIIPSGLIPNTGDTLLSITQITNPQTTCTSAVTVSDNFTINVIPPAPAAADIVFCIEEKAVVSDLIPFGNQFLWYASADAVTPLNSDTILNNGNYFVSETSNTGCFSPRTAINVTITELPPLTLNPDGEKFCGADDPTLENLTANVTGTDMVLWYDAAQNGNLLANDLLLQEGATYYCVQYSETLGCTSQEVLAVTVSLTECNENPSQYDFFIPDGFSPNGDGTNDTFRIPDIEFIYPDYTYEIYNRYGNILFKGNINKPAWDGTNTESGGERIAPNGVYFYVIKFNKNSVSSKQGRLYLNR